MFHPHSRFLLTTCRSITVISNIIKHTILSFVNRDPFFFMVSSSSELATGIDFLRLSNGDVSCSKTVPPSSSSCSSSLIFNSISFFNTSLREFSSLHGHSSLKYSSNFFFTRFSCFKYSYSLYLLLFPSLYSLSRVLLKILARYCFRMLEELESNCWVDISKFKCMTLWNSELSRVLMVFFLEKRMKIRNFLWMFMISRFTSITCLGKSSELPPLIRCWKKLNCQVINGSKALKDLLSISFSIKI